MKKIFLFLAAVLSLFGTAVNAENVGDVTGVALYSDLSVYINHYPISAYVINDYAVIVAEDLENYCCDVVWNGNDRTLNISKSADKTEFTPPAVYKTSMPQGSVKADVLYTDIKTYVNGNLVKSFNVNGKTMIVIDEFGNNMDGYAWVPELRAAKAWLDDKPMKQYEPLSDRTVLIYKNDDWTNRSYYGEADINFDGIDEKISLELSDEQYDSWNEKMRVSVGNASKIIDTYGAEITKVFVCDVDAYDGHKDIAVITVEESEDPVLRLFGCNESYLSRYNFMPYNKYGDYYVLDELWTGYVDDHHFNINDDGSITVEMQTPSAGMWSVNRTFYRDDYGTFVEKKPDYYTILPKFMEENGEYIEIYGKERTMWQQGYIKAYYKYRNNGVTINKGEYFKVVYDDGNNNLYIVKENGAAGWISTGYDNYQDLFELNEYFFYLAG